MSKFTNSELTTKSGKLLHPIGIGTWGIASQRSEQKNSYKGVQPKKGNEEAEIAALRHSLDAGQNHIDCAELYGGFYTDEVVGQALQGHERKDLFIADKLWRTSLSQGKVRGTVSEMLRKLKTDYLDLLYIHWPWSEDGVHWQDAIPQIDDLIEAGTVRGLAISNFTITQMKEAQKLSRHPLLANQMNYNVLYRDEVNEQFRQFCSEQNVVLIAYQPIKRGEVFEHPVLQQLARKHNATESQIALAWLLQQNALPIPKATTIEHIDDNIQALNISLGSSDLEKLNSI